MGLTAQQVIKVAESQIGYLEKASNSQLDDFTANAGSNNYQKYGRDLYNAGYYNGNKNGYEWCDQFVDWCFWIAADKNKVVAETCQCQYGFTGGAGCTNSRAYFKQNGRLSSTPKVGDQAFFSETQQSDPSNADHTGIVVAVNLPYVTIIEGNKSNSVAKTTYTLNNGWLYDFGHPNYDSGSSSNATAVTTITKTYTVKYGDTLYDISQQYNISIQKLSELNNITDVNSIFVGQILKLSGDSENSLNQTKTINLDYQQTTKEDSKAVWCFLSSWLNNDYGVAGLMGNLYAESGLIANNLQNTYEKSLGYTDESYTNAVDQGKYNNFVNDAGGYGIAQWTYYTRKQQLLNYAKEFGNASIGNLSMQLNFLRKELTQSYAGLVQTLKLATSIYDAASVVLTQFERPYDTSEAVKKLRTNYGKKYFDMYSTIKDTNQYSENTKQDNNQSTLSNTNEAIKTAQKFYNKELNINLDIDGEWGPLTNDAAIKYLQKAIGTDPDGEIGPDTINKINKNYVKFGSTGKPTMAIQAALSKFGYNLTIDGFAGNNTINAIKDFQKQKNLEVDGIAGSDTFKALLI